MLSVSLFCNVKLYHWAYFSNMMRNFFFFSIFYIPRPSYLATPVFSSCFGYRPEQTKMEWKSDKLFFFSQCSLVPYYVFSDSKQQEKKLTEFKNVEYFLQAFRTYMPLLFRLKKAESRFKKWLIWGSFSDWDTFLKLQMLHTIILILQIFGSLSIKK